MASAFGNFDWLFEPELDDAGGEDLVDDPGPRCRRCGCTNTNGCPGGCIWAKADLCSRCALEEADHG